MEILELKRARVIEINCSMDKFNRRYAQTKRELVTDGKFRKELKRHVRYIKRSNIDPLGGQKERKRITEC